MKIIEEEEVHRVMAFPDLVDDLEEVFAGAWTMPPRQVLKLDESSGRPDAFAMLPVWDEGLIALKAFTYFPENGPGLRSLYSKVLLFDRRCGVPLAMIDGSSVTYWRTAGVSALASRFLSREDSEVLTVLGTGRLLPFLVRAHLAVRPIREVRVWGRNPEKAAEGVGALAEEHPAVRFRAAGSLEDACRETDVLVAATGSTEILVRGEWLREGTHVDLLGNHHADHRECDTRTIERARVWVDSRANVEREAGELLIPIREGAFSWERLEGELAQLCRREIAGRETAEEITVFKSVGCAVADLAGARRVYRRLVETS